MSGVVTVSDMPVSSQLVVVVAVSVSVGVDPLARSDMKSRVQGRRMQRRAAMNYRNAWKYERVRAGQSVVNIYWNY